MKMTLEAPPTVTEVVGHWSVISGGAGTNARDGYGVGVLIVANGKLTELLRSGQLSRSDAHDVAHVAAASGKRLIARFYEALAMGAGQNGSPLTEHESDITPAGGYERDKECNGPPDGVLPDQDMVRRLLNDISRGIEPLPLDPDENPDYI